MYSRLFSGILGLLLLAGGASHLQAEGSLPSADEVLRRLLEHGRGPQPEPQGYYLCTKQTVTEEMDRSGRVTSRKVKVGESKSQPNESANANKWGGQNGIAFDQDLLQRFDFTVAKKETINGRPTFLLTFAPKNPLWPIHRIQDRLLNRARGSLWIDEQDSELVKADLALSEPVSFGILGAVDVLQFSFERTHVDGGEWLTHWTETNFKGRKFVIPIQIRKRVDCGEYKKQDPQLTADRP